MNMIWVSNCGGGIVFLFSMKAIIPADCVSTPLTISSSQLEVSLVHAVQISHCSYATDESNKTNRNL